MKNLIEKLTVGFTIMYLALTAIFGVKAFTHWLYETHFAFKFIFVFVLLGSQLHLYFIIANRAFGIGKIIKSYFKSKQE